MRYTLHTYINIQYMHYRIFIVSNCCTYVYMNIEQSTFIHAFPLAAASFLVSTLDAVCFVLHLRTYTVSHDTHGVSEVEVYVCK